VAALCAPFYAFLISEQQIFLVMLAMSAIVIMRHHSNIKRLITGDEPLSNLGRTKPHGGKA
jgi:glycerol-3-phosphate acyltransferase PlsY